MNSNDIPEVPQFLLQNAGRHHAQAILAGAPDDDQDQDKPEGAPASPLFDLSHAHLSQADLSCADLSHVDLLADEEAEIFSQPAEISLPASPVPLPVSAAPSPPPPALSPASVGAGYSAGDLELFRSLTGYHLDVRTGMPRAIDASGNRASAMDRLFTTLAEEAFKLADRQRRMGVCPERDLTVEDLVVTLVTIRRAAAAIGSRGLIAFETLDAAVARLKTGVTAGLTTPGAEAVAA